MFISLTFPTQIRPVYLFITEYKKLWPVCNRPQLLIYPANITSTLVRPPCPHKKLSRWIEANLIGDLFWSKKSELSLKVRSLHLCILYINIFNINNIFLKYIHACVCIYIYIINIHSTHTSCKQRLLLWMWLIAINRLTALIHTHTVYILKILL